MSANYTSLLDVNEYVKTMGNKVLNNRDISVMRWDSALDNHNPVARSFGAGFVVKYRNDNVGEGYVLFHDGQFGINTKLAFAVDNGKTTRLFYLASWNVSGGFFILHPFPIDMEMGPRKLYQIRVKPLDNHVENTNNSDIVTLDDFPYVVHKAHDK